MPQEPHETQTVFQVGLPEGAEPGTFADFARVWHTDDVFVLDFAALTSPITDRRDESGESQRVVAANVVSRVRIAPQQVFELAKALTRELENWELQTGRKPPTSPLFPTED